MTNPTLLTESEAAQYLSLMPKTLARWRWAGQGPTFLKIGGAIRYQVEDLDLFLELSKRVSTTDRANAHVVQT